MLAYILVVIFPLLVERWYKKKIAINNLPLDSEKNKKIRWRYIFLAALPMFFLIAFRNQSIGADTGMYINHFNRMINTPWSKIFDKATMEEGYLVFVKLITIFTDNPLIYQIICATIYLLAITSFTNQQEENHFLILFLFGTLGMYTFMFTGVRQCLAISICLFSYQYIKNRKIVPFVILMFVAFYFHKSSILFASAYIIYPRKLSFWNTLIYAAIVIFAVLYLDVIQQWFNEQLEYDYEIEGGAGGVIFTALVVAMTTFTIFIVVSNKATSKNAQGLINIGLIATLFWALRLFTRVAERPSYYFLICVFASFAYSISTLKKQNEKDILKILVVVFALALFVYRLTANQASFVPYTFFDF